MTIYLVGNTLEVTSASASRVSALDRLKYASFLHRFSGKREVAEA